MPSWGGTRAWKSPSQARATELCRMHGACLHRTSEKSSNEGSLVWREVRSHRPTFGSRRRGVTSMRAAVWPRLRFADIVARVDRYRLEREEGGRASMEAFCLATGPMGQ